MTGQTTPANGTEVAVALRSVVGVGWIVIHVLVLGLV